MLANLASNPLLKPTFIKTIRNANRLDLLDLNEEELGLMELGSACGAKYDLMNLAEEELDLENLAEEDLELMELCALKRKRAERAALAAQGKGLMNLAEEELDLENLAEEELDLESLWEVGCHLVNGDESRASRIECRDKSG
jgi:hypothetical protein